MIWLAIIGLDLRIVFPRHAVGIIPLSWKMERLNHLSLPRPVNACAFSIAQYLKQCRCIHGSSQSCPAKSVSMWLVILVRGQLGENIPHASCLLANHTRSRILS